MKIKKGDNVIVSRGKDKHKKGKVLRGFRKGRQILVEGVNLKKVHKRATRQGEKGQIVERAFPIDIFKVKLVCPRCNQPTRVGYKLAADKKTRTCKRCHEEI